MATNTTVLIVVTAAAALVLVGVLVAVAYKTRTPKRRKTVRDQAEEDLLELRRRKTLADEYAGRPSNFITRETKAADEVTSPPQHGSLAEPKPTDV
ncbi:hypothetical protein [Mycobacterium sp. MMS18-G62]